MDQQTALLQRDTFQSEPGRQVETTEQNTPHTEITAAQVKTRIDLILRDYGLLLGGTHRRNLDHDIATIVDGLKSKNKLPSNPDTAWMTIIQELTIFYAYQVQLDYIEGDLHGTIKYLAIINELCRAMNTPLPQSFFFYFDEVSRRAIHESPLERLFNLLERRMSGDEESRQPPHESSEPKRELKNIPHANKTISELIELARKAIQDKNWQLSLEYQIAISERPDEDRDPGKALFYLAIAYKNVGDHQMALKTLDRREAQYPRTLLDRSCDNTLRIKLQRAISSGEKSEPGTTIIWPSHYFHLPQNTDFTTCDTVKLIAYSIQAQKVKDWGTVVRIQKVVALRTPNKAIAHIPLSYALRQLGQGEEADMVAERARACPDYIGEKTKPTTNESSNGAKKPEPDLPPKVLAHNTVDALLAEAENQRVAALQQPPPLKPKKTERELPPSSIDISNFTNFLETFIAQAATWSNDAVRGTTWKKVPDSDKQVLREYLTGPAKWKLQAILKGTVGNNVFQSLETIERHVGKGSVDTSILSELQQRYVTLPNELKTRITNEVK